MHVHGSLTNRHLGCSPMGCTCSSSKDHNMLINPLSWQRLLDMRAVPAAAASIVWAAYIRTNPNLPVRTSCSSSSTLHTQLPRGRNMRS